MWILTIPGGGMPQSLFKRHPVKSWWRVSTPKSILSPMPDYWLTTACNAIPEKHLGQNSEIFKATATISPLWELSTYICIVHMYISSPFLVHKFPTVHSRRLVCKANPDQLPGFPHPVVSSPDLSNKTKTQQFYKHFFSQFQRPTHQHSVRFAFWLFSKIPAVPLAALKHAGFFQHSVQSAPAFKTLSGDMLQIKRTSTSGQVSCGM